MNFAFVVLHYKALDATLECVGSIQGLEVPAGHSVLVVIVDNGSDDGTYERLVDRFASCDAVTVVTTGENLGFARGNNFGLGVALGMTDPDFVIATNNDIVVPDGGFLDSVVAAYGRTNFGVLGPDVYNPYTHQHQSPCGPGLTSLDEVDDLISRSRLGLGRLERPAARDRLYLAARDSAIGDLLAALKHRVLGRFENRGWETPHEGLVLQGSFLVFSRRWLEQLPFLFYPETFMYLEENFLQLLALRHALRLVYEPSIQVHHLHGISTRVGRTRWSDRQRFYYEQVLRSLGLYRNLLSDPALEGI